MPRKGLGLLLIWLWSALATAGALDVPSPDWPYVEKKLQKARLSKKFIYDMKQIYRANDFMKVMELNTLLFLRATDYHGPQVSGDAVAEVRTFLEKNKSAFDQVEKSTGVSREAISSLLYIETRHGGNKGSFHVASVFLHLVQADRPSVIRYLKARLPHYTNHYDNKTQAKISKRAKTKADWALAELKALAQMFKRDAHLVKGLKGSFSGAFGMAQFIPSSYTSLARPLKKGQVADLSKPGDAIASVAHYLQVSGWKRTQKRSHKRALMRYNNSEDYAKAILSLAGRASAKRDTASVKKKKKKS